MKNILVPVDFSENARHALMVAAELAVKAGASIELLHVSTNLVSAPVFPEYPTSSQIEAEDEQQISADMLALLKVDVETDTRFKGVNVSIRQEGSSLCHAITTTIEEDHCDLVVMGTKGITSATDVLLGSNTEKIIRHANCPVLAVPEKSGPFFPQAAVIATTLQPDQLPAFRLLAEWQKMFNLTIKIVYVATPASFVSSNELERAAETLCKLSGVKDYSLCVAPVNMSHEKTILQCAYDNRADMILLATHQRKGLSHLFFGSITEDIANHSQIPVLSVPVAEG